MSSDPERGECQDCEELQAEINYLEDELGEMKERYEDLVEAIKWRRTR